jgi:hypothetical protein
VDETSGSYPGGVRTYSLDETSAKKLWKWSEEVTGIDFRTH